MAKSSKSISFKNATISDGVITEYIKDDVRTYQISKIIKDWEGIDGLSISIRYDEDVASDEGGD